jgi:hypothetical protein
LGHLLANSRRAVPDRDHVGVEIVELQQGPQVLPLVQIEAGPRPIFTDDYNSRVYSQIELDWISRNDMSSVLLRRYP